MNLLILFLLLFLFLLINFNNAQLIELTPENDISLSIDNGEYNKFTSNTYCYLKYNIIINDKYIGDSLSVFNTTLDDQPFFINKDNRISLYQLIFSVPVGNSFVFNLTLTTVGSKFSIYQLNQTCSYFINENKIYELDTYPFYSSNYFYSMVKVDDSDDLIFKTLAINGYFPKSQVKNHYFIDWNVGNLNQDDLNLNWTKVITFSNNNYNITFISKSYWSQFKLPKKPSEIIFYPSNVNSTSSTISVFKEFGIGFTPILKTTIETDIQRPCLYMCNGLGCPDGYVVLQPSKGRKGNMTFIGTTRSRGESNLILSDNSTLINYPINSMFNLLEIPALNSGGFVPSLSTFIKNLPGFLCLTASFKSTSPFKFTTFDYNYIDSNLYKSWPFGFFNGNNENYTHSFSFQPYSFLNENIDSIYSFSTAGGLGDSLTQILILGTQKIVGNPNDIQLISFKYSKINSNRFILSLNILSKYGVESITFINTYTNEILVSGTIYNGIFEIVTSRFPGSLLIFDIYHNSKYIYQDDIISIQPQVIKFQSPFPSIDLKYSDFENITYSINDLDIKDKDNYLIAYLKSDQIPNNISLNLILMENIGDTEVDIDVFSRPFVYDSTLDLFTCKFIIKKNKMFGDYFITFFYQNYGTVPMLPGSPQLRVNNTILDNEGPQIIKISKINNELHLNSITNDSGVIGWDITISDDINGFDSGYIKVMGSLDSSTYHFNFTSTNFLNGNRFEGIYQVLIDVSTPCVSQNYSIVYVELYDSNQIVSRFELYNTLQVNAVSTPFTNLYQNSEDGGLSVTVVSLFCSPSVIDTSSPTLLSFTSSKSVIDVGLADRTISFNFEIKTSESGVKTDQRPIIYMLTKRMELKECLSKIIWKNSTYANYTCTTQLPLGFGYPGEILLSVYGIVNNGGQYNGFSTDDLLLTSSGGYINTTLTVEQPILISNEIYYSDDSELIIYGRTLSNIDYVIVTYVDTTSQRITPTTLYESSAMKLLGIKSTEKPFTIKAYSKTGIESNEYVVNPVYFKLTTKKLEPTPTPSSTPIPSNPPQICLGKPLCGGEKQGYCADQGCVCINNWIGPDCSSQIIIVPTPTINNTDPSVVIPTIPIGGDNSSNLPEILFKSFISLVSLREIDYNGQQVANHIFDKWIYTPISEFKNQYNTSILNTNITATLEWFNSSTTISFANQSLSMNPSTIKYTIEITGEYKFTNQLNQLELIMFASFESSKTNDICSNKEFGNTTTGDNSNYLKIQIDNHSLYGRFIKRAIVDGVIRSVSNKPLDSSLNVLSSSSSVQSYIAITVPQFKNQIIVDPDFSVLIDSNSASSSSTNSICSLSSSGLTKAQLAGIIIGSIAFFIVIVIIITYAIVKSRNQKKFLASVNNKLKNMN